MNKQTLKYFILGNIGGIIYSLIEIFYRGYTHWTMYIVSFILFILLGGINEFLSGDTPLWKQALIGTTIVTIVEFIAGCIINIKLGWDVWDYSSQPFNLMGQICLPFCIIWFFLSIVAIVVDDYLRYLLFDEEKPNYKIF